LGAGACSTTFSLTVEEILDEIEETLKETADQTNGSEDS